MSCRNCVYFNKGGKFRCAVNPIAAEGYHPDRPNDCIDFQLISSSLTEQRQLASPSQLTAQLHSEICQLQSNTHWLITELQQFNCEQVEMENMFAELGFQLQVEQEHQHLVSKSESEKQRKLRLIASGQTSFVASLCISMILLCFNHHLIARYTLASGFGAVTFAYGYTLHPRKPD